MNYLKINKAKEKIKKLGKILYSVRNKLDEYEENKVFEEFNNYINERGLYPS